MTKPPTVWRDGMLVPFADATIHVLSHAANRGTEVFDVLRVVETASGPAAVGLRPHVARFDQSMELMGMEPELDVAGLERAVAETVLANPGSTTVKLIAVWAEIPGGTLPVSRRPSLLVAAVGNDGAAVGVGEPVRIRTSVMPKIPASILPPSLKVGGSYTAAVRQQLDALEAGYDDVVFRTAEGRLAEATAQSLLVVDSGQILAPPLDAVLDGITRRLLLDLARHDGRTIVVGDVHWDQVSGASELLFTSTSAFVRPISRLDDRDLPAPGPVANRFGEQLAALVAGDHPLSARWLTPLKALVA